MIPEKILLDYLGAALNVPICLELYDGLPDRFVLIERTGSSEENFIYSASFAIQSYAESLYQAAMLNERVKYNMKRLVAEDTISAVRLVSDYNWTDPTTKRYRYQAIYNIVFF